MDKDKARFLFGAIPTGLDPDDEEDRSVLLQDVASSMHTPLAAAIREVVATQIATDDPPEVWEVARRLQAAGMDRAKVLDELTVALMDTAGRTLAEGKNFDVPAYVAALGQLPLPTRDEIEPILVDLVLRRRGIGVDDLIAEALVQLGRGEGGDLVQRVLDGVLDGLSEDWGPLAMLAGDRMVHVASLTDGIVLTRRLSEAEAALGALTAGFDLAGFTRLADPTLAGGGEIEIFSEEPGHLAWVGPDGWLQRYPPGTLLRIQAGADAVVSIGAIDEPPLDPILVARLRAVYDDEVEEPWLPVSAEDLLLGVLLEQPESFTEAQTPLSELCAAAGLEQRVGAVAHEESVWENGARVARMFRVTDRLEDPDARSAALGALELADDPGAEPEDLRKAMAGLRDPVVLSVVADELLGLQDDPDAIDRADGYGQRLLAAAKRPPDIAVARWIAAVVAERRGETLVADAQVQLALKAGPNWPPALDRAAWYASDRGDAATAAGLWRDLGDRGSRDLAMVEEFAEAPRRLVGRNDACWCGSGRKFKNCHLNHPEPAPLPDRVGWLCSKATAYIERRGGAAALTALEYAAARAVDPDDPSSVAAAFEDPIVIDVALTEAGWFERFLADRGPLLPDDEKILAASWTLAPRSVHEILEVRPGSGITVRDLATGDRLDVRERMFSRQAQAGQLVCARVVPDGETHQFIGGMFPVAPGTESEVLDLCEHGRGAELCNFVARQHRPPRLRTREGEPLVTCTATFEVSDESALRAFLDDRYESEEGGWVELFAISDDEDILRAQLDIEEGRLVVSTHSEPRMERVLGVLGAGMQGLRLLSDERVPLRPGEMPTPRRQPPGGLPDDEALQAALLEVQEQAERRWIDESVPALGGVTPREAAADPTRREQLERLIASFPDPARLPAGSISMRPARLRELLGLPPLPAGTAGLPEKGL